MMRLATHRFVTGFKHAANAGCGAPCSASVDRYLFCSIEKDQDWDCVGFQMFGFWHVCRLFLFDFRRCCCCVPLLSALVVVESSCCCGYRVWFCGVVTSLLAVVGVSALLLLLSMLLGDEYASKKLGAAVSLRAGASFPVPLLVAFSLLGVGNRQRCGQHLPPASTLYRLGRNCLSSRFHF